MWLTKLLLLTIEEGGRVLNCEACSAFLQSFFALTVSAVAFALSQVGVLRIARVFGHSQCMLHVDDLHGCAHCIHLQGYTADSLFQHGACLETGPFCISQCLEQWGGFL